MWLKCYAQEPEMLKNKKAGLSNSKALPLADCSMAGSEQMPVLRLIGRQTTAKQRLNSNKTPNHSNGAGIRNAALIVPYSGNPASHKGAYGPADQPLA